MRGFAYITTESVTNTQNICSNHSPCLLSPSAYTVRVIGCNIPRGRLPKGMKILTLPRDISHLTKADLVQAMSHDDGEDVYVLSAS